MSFCLELCLELCQVSQASQGHLTSLFQRYNKVIVNKLTVIVIISYYLISCLFRSHYLYSIFYSENFPLLIFRVRLVERGSPHSLPLTESGKVVEAAILLMNTDGYGQAGLG